MTEEPSLPPSLTDVKQELRRQQFRRRKQAHTEQNALAAQAIIAPVQAIIDDFALEIDSPELVVAGYWPIRTEIDPRSLISTLQHEGHQLVLPVVPGPDVRLEFRRFVHERDLTEGAFGARIPTDQSLGPEPQVLLVPLLAYDAKGFRLGYGGGYFDRTLEDLRAKHPVMAIGLAYEAQEVDEVPIEPTDQHLNAIITPTAIMRF